MTWIVSCDVEDCKNNQDGKCTLEEISISDSVLTSAGFLPMCEDYEVKEVDYECD